jgi:LysR family transcriptional regulator, hydrogen peroxide-inducible genes activator
MSALPRKRTLVERVGMSAPHLETIYSSAVKAKRVSQDLTELRKIPLKLGIMSTISPFEIVDLIAALHLHRFAALDLS